MLPSSTPHFVFLPSLFCVSVLWTPQIKDSLSSPFPVPALLSSHVIAGVGSHLSDPNQYLPALRYSTIISIPEAKPNYILALEE